jgi:hypothetical protein
MKTAQKNMPVAEVQKGFRNMLTSLKI